MKKDYLECETCKQGDCEICEIHRVGTRDKIFDHTSGLWKFSKSFLSIGDENLTGTIARLDYDSSERPDEEIQANGRLIAYAPNLLHSLIDTLTELEVFYACNPLLSPDQLSDYTNLVNKITGKKWDEIKSLDYSV